MEIAEKNFFQSERLNENEIKEIDGYFRRDVIAEYAKVCTFNCIHGGNVRCNPELDCKTCTRYNFESENTFHVNLNETMLVM